MMFSGPHAASPPKNTPARVDCIVVLSTMGMSVLVEVDADVALDPRERVVLADRENDVVARDDDRVDDFALLLAASSSNQRSRSNSMPTSLPFSRTNVFGAWFSTISTPSSSASSSSHGDALKCGRERRAMTFTSVAAEPLRRAAAVHRRVADADDQHALADLLDMAEVRRAEPLDADVDVRRSPRRGRECRGSFPSARRCRRTRRRSSRRAAHCMLVTGEL